MQKIKTVAVIGAGALGLLYADKLAASLGNGLYFLADEERRKRIASTEYSINGRSCRFDARTPSEVDSPPDLLIVAVKNHNLEAIVPLADSIAGPDTVVISVLNGIESEEYLEGRLSRGRILYCVALGMDAVKEGAELRYSSPGRLLVGTADNDPHNPDLLRLSDLLAESGIGYEIPADIIRSLWWKWMINIGVNQVSAVCGATYGLFKTHAGIRSLMDDAMNETVRVAQAEGVKLGVQDISDWYPLLESLGSAGKTSMLQDMEAGRKTEVEAFSGRLLELAARHGLAVPVNTTLMRIITAREALFQADPIK